MGTITSCDIPNVGASGVAQVHNGMCVLTQNIVNEKIYLVLWFWYLFLGPVSVLYLCYRLITLMFHGVRYSLLYRKVRRKYDWTSRDHWSLFCPRDKLGTGLFSISYQKTV